MADDEGDELGAIVELHRAELYRRALKLSRKPDIAEDLVQETMVRALRWRDRLPDGGHVGAWLATILTHLYFDYWKHKQVVRKAEQEIEQEIERMEQEVDGDDSLLRISDERLAAAIQALEPDLREVIELCYLRKLRYRAAAAQLRVAQGTIATRLFRARKRLRELLMSPNLRVVKS